VRKRACRTYFGVSRRARRSVAIGATADGTIAETVDRDGRSSVLSKLGGTTSPPATKLDPFRSEILQAVRALSKRLRVRMPGEEWVLCDACSHEHADENSTVVSHVSIALVLSVVMVVWCAIWCQA
jgi:hypothetical protein